MASLDKDTPIVLIEEDTEYKFSLIFYLGEGISKELFEPILMNSKGEPLNA